MNTIRAIPELNLDQLNFRFANEGNFYLSVLVPLMSYIIIILSIEFKKKRVSYFIDVADGFFLSSIILMFVYSLITPVFLEGIEYAFKYLFIAVPFYFMSKIIIINNQSNFEQQFLKYFNVTVLVSFLTGSLGFLLAYSVDFFEPSLGSGIEYKIRRITIPGVYPIPFAQVIGFGALIIFCSMFSRGAFLKYKKKYNFVFILLFLYLIFLVMISNTRGILVAIFIAMSFFLYMYPRKVISQRNLRIVLVVIAISVIFSLYFFDFSKSIDRLLNTFNNDRSVSSRTDILLEAFRIGFTNPIGVGTSGFIYKYPHNIFLDYIVSFGLVGWFMSVYFALMIWYFFTQTFKRRYDSPILILLFCIIIYFFTEALISFTLWMHKGLYISIGLFTSYLYLYKKEELKKLDC
ncbi:MAG: O-antigen ligase family protein [Algibacter sp.]